jgi:hypothetical protein
LIAPVHEAARVIITATPTLALIAGNGTRIDFIDYMARTACGTLFAVAGEDMRHAGQKRDNTDDRLTPLSRFGRRGQLHALAAFVFCLALPGVSWLQGTGWLAWTMFSGSATYRVSSLVWDGTGEARPVAATELAAHARGDAAVFLSGSERWRRAPHGPTLARHAPDLTTLACSATGAARARVTVEFRMNLDDPVRTVRAERACR